MGCSTRKGKFILWEDELYPAHFQSILQWAISLSFHFKHHLTIKTWHWKQHKTSNGDMPHISHTRRKKNISSYSLQSLICCDGGGRGGSGGVWVSGDGKWGW